MLDERKRGKHNPCKIPNHITNDDQNPKNHTIITPLEQLQQMEMKFYLTPTNHMCVRTEPNTHN